MKLVQVEGSTITISMHWAEAAAVAEVLQISGFDGDTSIAAFFESAAYGSYLAAVIKHFEEPEAADHTFSSIQEELRYNAKFVMTTLGDKALRKKFDRATGKGKEKQ